MDIAGQIQFAKDNDIQLVIIGPEAPLVAGAVDQFQSAGIGCFGPSKACAQLEGSKDFTKQFLARHNIPTAAYQTFSELQPAIDFARKMTPPVVVKADGLAAGKGVVVAADHDEAEQALRDMLEDNAFGDAGARVVIEEFLQGEEASFIVMADGETFLPFASSQDHKAAYDGDKGPNTGGMGAYSPAPVITPEIHQRIIDEVMMPTIEGLAKEGMPYVGFLYAGLMINKQGEPKVIEFNCRFGDPETQPIMMRLNSDLVALCLAAIDGKLNDERIEFDDRTALTVVMAAGGYPNDYPKGDAIDGIAAEDKNGKTFHAGTAIKDNQVVTTGGRVLGVTGLGHSVSEANKQAYQRVAAISFAGAEYRTDIGYRAIERESAS
jgi:phosphoribosylamine--glycine ligase